MTDRPGVVLGVLAADCAPVLLADADAGVIGAAHAGWKGALAASSTATIAAMERLGARRDSVRAAIGPCIGRDSYEVGPEFPAPFLAQDEANDAFFRPAPRAGHFLFDLAGYLAHRIARGRRRGRVPPATTRWRRATISSAIAATRCRACATTAGACRRSRSEPDVPYLIILVFCCLLGVIATCVHAMRRARGCCLLRWRRAPAAETVRARQFRRRRYAVRRRTRSSWRSRRPRNMPPEMAKRVAAALAIELQSYGIVATVQPAPAPIQVSGTMSTRDAAEHRHRDPDRLARRRQSRRSAGPGDQPDARATGGLCRGERAAGVAHRPAGRAAHRHLDRQAADLPGALARPGRGRRRACRSEPTAPMPRRPWPPVGARAPASAPQRAGATAAAGQGDGGARSTGAPSDGNRQLFSGMRRALGSSKIVVVDAAGADIFTVVGTVSLTPIDEQTGPARHQMGPEGPAGKEVGELEQSNPVPLAAAQGLVGGLRRHRRDRRRPKASSNLLEKAIDRAALGRARAP